MTETAFDQLTATQALIANLLAVHSKGYDTESDEAYGSNPVCDECRRPYPCDVRVALSVAPSDALATRDRQVSDAVFGEVSVILTSEMNRMYVASRYGSSEKSAEYLAVGAALIDVAAKISEHAAARL